jgi:hypothetical protein
MEILGRRFYRHLSLSSGSVHQQSKMAALLSKTVSFVAPVPSGRSRTAVVVRAQQAPQDVVSPRWSNRGLHALAKHMYACT